MRRILGSEYDAAVTRAGARGPNGAAGMPDDPN